MGAPVLILASRDSCGSLLAQLLGGHPDFHAAPHLNLLAFPELWQFRTYARIPRDPHIHGFLRFLGECLIREQTVQSVQAARRWIQVRERLPNREVYRLLADFVAPARLVDHSPLYVHDSDVLRRVLAAVPEAKVVHLTRGPLAHGHASLAPIWQTFRAAQNWWTDWALDQPCMDAFELGEAYVDWSAVPPVFDSQFYWHRTQRAILEVEPEQPAERWLRLKAEDLLGDPEATLGRVLDHLDAVSDAATLAAMIGQERTTFGCMGPYEAPYGIDFDVVGKPLRDALAQPAHADPIRPDAPVPWRGDGERLLDPVLILAERLGYSVGTPE